ncbi:MAG: tyrosine-type recombinase/integrase [bacterium]|nr:tyrosine-type recombinase/integrase [bacterium]
MATSNVVRLPGPSDGSELLEAVGSFLVDADLAASTVEVYERTLEALIADIGGDVDVASITRAQIDRHLKARYADTAATTFNRNLATIGSFFTWCEDTDLITISPSRKLRRRKVRVSIEAERQARPIPFDELQALWQDHRAHSLRDRTFWVMAYETAARSAELLGLDIEHLDPANKEAVVIGKGGSAERVYWASGTARLLHRLITGRTAGPVFVTDRLPRSHVLPATSDLCPTTGRARLSYRRAAEIFTTASGGRTLHQLRHSALTHLAENGESLVKLKAKSRHRSTRSLERYTNPSAETIRDLTNRHDPNRRTPPH